MSRVVAASAEKLGDDLNGDQLGVAAGILDRLDGIFRRESSHSECELAVGCGLDGSAVNALHVFRGASTAAVHFHKKLGVLQSVHSVSLQARADKHRCKTGRRHDSPLLLSLLPGRVMNPITLPRARIKGNFRLGWPIAENVKE